MSKKTNKNKISTYLSKTTHDNLVRYSGDKHIFMADVIETALKEFFDPFDKENHEKNTKMQLAMIVKMLFGVTNRMDLSLICHEEFVKTFYRNIPELALEDSQAKALTQARIIEGTDNFLKRVFDSGINSNPNILSAFNITKSEV
jgi:hypothetical protein